VSTEAAIFQRAEDNRVKPVFVLPADVWKKNRNRIVAAAKRKLHVQQTNPGPEHRLRFDYVLTAAEVAVLVESVMRDTERLVVWHITKEKEK
jgi:hypothetical protein